MDVIGLDVRGDAVRAGASVAGDLADQLASARRAWSATADQPGAVSGHAELTSEYRSMVDAWFAEVGTHIEVLEELCAAIYEAAGGYDRAGHESVDATGTRR